MKSLSVILIAAWFLTGSSTDAAAIEGRCVAFCGGGSSSSSTNYGNQQYSSGTHYRPGPSPAELAKQKSIDDFNAATRYFNEGKHNYAITYYEYVLQYDPYDAEAKRQLQIAKSYRDEDAGNVEFDKHRNWDRAIAYYDSALSHYSDNHSARKNRLAALHNKYADQGYEKWRQENLSEAIRLFERAQSHTWVDNTARDLESVREQKRAADEYARQLAEQKERERIVKEKKRVIEHYEGVKERILCEVEEERLNNRDILDKSIDAVGTGLTKAKQKFITWTYSETYKQTLGRIPETTRAVINRVKRFKATLQRETGHWFGLAKEGMDKGSQDLMDPDSSGEYADTYNERVINQLKQSQKDINDDIKTELQN